MHARAARVLLRCSAHRVQAARASSSRAAARTDAAPLSGAEGKERVLSQLTPLMRAVEKLPPGARTGAKTALSKYLHLERPNARSLPALCAALCQEAEAAEAAKAAPLLSLLSALQELEAAPATPQVSVDAPPKPRAAAATAASAALPTPSAEQCAVVDAVVAGQHNVLVNAVAGSGKTTTILHTAAALAAPTLALTYNARLKIETRSKAKALGLTCLDVHSFHAFGVRHYGPDCYRDAGLLDVVRHNRLPRLRFSFECVIIDEAQDLTPLLYAFVCKLMRDNGGDAPCRLLLLGDERQTIFQFRDADARYLTRCADVFAGVTPALPWLALTLSTTYRMTGNMVDFLNRCVLHRPHFRTPRPRGKKVRLYTGNAYDIVETLGPQLVTMLRTGVIVPSDAFVLAPSMRTGTAANKQPYNILSNILTAAGCPVYVPLSDEEKLDEDVMRNKAVLSSFHQAKGLERKLVVVFNYEASYFKFFAKETQPASRSVCPNALYVATTRATELLCLVGHGALGHELPFLRRTEPSDFLDVIPCSGALRKQDLGGDEGWSTASVSRLTRYLSEETLSEAMRYVRTAVVCEPHQDTQVPLRIDTSQGGVALSEDVAELNGLAVPAFFERQSTGKMCSMQAECTSDFAGGHAYLVEAQKAPSDMPGFLRLAAIYGYITGGFMAKPEQIKEYTWLTPELYDPLLDVLQTHLGGLKVEYEVPMTLTPDASKGKTSSPMEVTGRMDAVTDEHIYELKCTQRVTPEHLLQLSLYGWLWAVTPKGTGTKCAATHGPRALRLLNFRTGELLEVTSSAAELAHVARVLIEAYLRGDPNLSDDAFMRQCAAARKPFLRGA